MNFSIKSQLKVCAIVGSSLFFAGNAFSMEYEYDALGRLITVIYDNGKRVEYKYDEAGNRTEVVVNG